MELKLLSYEDSGKAYVEGTTEFDKRLPPLVDTENFTIQKIGVETENEDMWGVRYANEAQAKLTANWIISECLKLDDWYKVKNYLEELRGLASK
jgi:hypothetical protein